MYSGSVSCRFNNSCAKPKGCLCQSYLPVSVGDKKGRYTHTWALFVITGLCCLTSQGSGRVKPSQIFLASVYDSSRECDWFVSNLYSSSGQSHLQLSGLFDLPYWWFAWDLSQIPSSLAREHHLYSTTPFFFFFFGGCCVLFITFVNICVCKVVL